MKQNIIIVFDLKSHQKSICTCLWSCGSM